MTHRAIYTAGNPIPAFPFDIADYLSKTPMSLSERNPIAHKSAKRPRGTITPEIRQRMKETRFANTLDKYVTAIKAFPDGATAMQISLHFGYNPTSMANTLKKISEVTDVIVCIRLTRPEYAARGIAFGSGPLPYIWSYNPNATRIFTATHKDI